MTPGNNKKNINIYGDKLEVEFANEDKGTDIAVQRVDDLDSKMITYIKQHAGSHILELGSGRGGQSIRMVKAGAIVTAIDNTDFSTDFRSLQTTDAIKPNHLNFIHGDIRDVLDLTRGKLFTDAFSQRTLHYLTYPEALQLLIDLQIIIPHRLYLSATGLNTEIGQDYPDREKKVQDRWCLISPAMQEKHQIRTNVCLYTKEELIELASQAGWDVIEAWESEFRNIKTIFENRQYLKS